MATTATNATTVADSPAPAPVTSPVRAESRSATAENEEDDDLDLNDIMSIFGGSPQDYTHVKRSSNDYYLDMDMAASSPKEQQYQWKTVQPKNSGANKKANSNSNNNGQTLKSGNGKVYTLHIVTNGEQQEGGSSKGGYQNNNNNNNNHQNHNHGGGLARVRSARSKIHVIPITMRSNGKADRSKTRIVKRFRNSRPDDHFKYDTHSHSEEVQDIILPAESEIVDQKYENQYEVLGPKEVHSNDLKQNEGSEASESQYLDHDPYDPAGDKVKVKHHHHHHHHNHVKTVIRKVPQPYPVEKIVHVPVEKIVHVPKPYPVDKFVEKVVHVPVERVIQVPRPVPVDRIVEKVVHVPKPYPVDRIVEKQVPVNRPVRVNVPYPVERIVHVPKPYPVEKIVEKIVHVPVIKHIRVPVPVEVKVPYPVNKPYPVKVEVEKQVPIQVEKRVPYPVKVYIPKPYPVETKAKVPDMDVPPKKNAFRTSNFGPKFKFGGGAQSYQSIQQGHQYPSSSGQEQQQQQYGQASSGPQFEQNYGSQRQQQHQLTAMDYGYSQGQQSQQQQQQQEAYPYQFEQSQNGDIQYGVNVMAAQPTGQETEQQDYVYNTNDQSQGSSMMGPSAADSVDAASSESVVNVQAEQIQAATAQGRTAFQINVPDQQSQAGGVAANEPQYGESKTVSHLLQITPFGQDNKAMYTRPVDQFVVFHTGTGFAVPKK